MRVLEKKKPTLFLGGLANSREVEYLLLSLKSRSQSIKQKEQMPGGLLNIYDWMRSD